MPEINYLDLLAVAAEIQKVASENGLTKKPPADDILTLYDTLVTNSLLRETTRNLFFDGHFALAVEEAFKCLNNFVKTRSALTVDGADLMRRVFSPKNPILRLNELKTESQINQQLGYMDIFAGCMTGIRNPRAHEHNYFDEPKFALEMLLLANHLFYMVKKATRCLKKV